jgi:hypothetical protein
MQGCDVPMCTVYIVFAMLLSLRAIEVMTLNIVITIAFLENIHRLVFYLKHDISETGFCLRLKVEPNQVGQIERASLCLRKTDL